MSMLRFNVGKAPLALLPTSFVLALAEGGVPFMGPTKLINGVADVLAFGATKYDMNNWRKGGSWISTLNSGLRHFQKHVNGELFDPESNLPHLAHLGCNLAFLMEFTLQGTEKDDRFVAVVHPANAMETHGLALLGHVLLNWKDGMNNEHLAFAVRILADIYEKTDYPNVA